MRCKETELRPFPDSPEGDWLVLSSFCSTLIHSFPFLSACNFEQKAFFRTLGSNLKQTAMCGYILFLMCMWTSAIYGVDACLHMYDHMCGAYMCMWGPPTLMSGLIHGCFYTFLVEARSQLNPVLTTMATVPSQLAWGAFVSAF